MHKSELILQEVETILKAALPTRKFYDNPESAFTDEELPALIVDGLPDERVEVDVSDVFNEMILGITCVIKGELPRPIFAAIRKEIDDVLRANKTINGMAVSVLPNSAQPLSNDTEAEDFVSTYLLEYTITYRYRW